MNQVSKQVQDIVQPALNDLKKNDDIARIWQHDHTVWNSQPTEIVNRLGWLHCPENMVDNISEIVAFVEDVKSAGFTQMLLLGMGGSSLAPEVFRMTFGVKKGYLDLAVLDSTHPDVVLNFAGKLDPVKTLFVVSTKSGGTVETLSFFKYFYNWIKDALGTGRAGEHFVAITDPGSRLETMAQELVFRKVFLNDPNIGGRFSALSFFGLVPAALVGVNIQKLLARAQKMAENSKFGTLKENESAYLGAVLGEFAVQGKDKLTFEISEPVKYFGAWAEQLIAESTGKNGKGILPVDLEELGDPGVYGDDRLFVSLCLADDLEHNEKLQPLRDAGFPVFEIRLNDLYDLGAEMFRWEFATAVAGQRLGIQPFDQPDVESAKVQARKMVSAYLEKGELPQPIPAAVNDFVEIYADFPVDDLRRALQEFIASSHDAGARHKPYVAIQAYVPPSSKNNSALQRLRHKIRDVYKVAVTTGFGPKFLHSTGQLHKGDSGNGLFLQLTASHFNDAGIPDEPGSESSRMTFGVLIDAQAMGDRQALIDKGRSVLRLHFTGDVVDGMNRIVQMI